VHSLVTRLSLNLETNLFSSSHTSYSISIICVYSLISSTHSQLEGLKKLKNLRRGFRNNLILVCPENVILFGFISTFFKAKQTSLSSNKHHLIPRIMACLPPVSPVRSNWIFELIISSLSLVNTLLGSCGVLGWPGRRLETWVIVWMID
jgi:hypothetical protein